MANATHATALTHSTRGRAPVREECFTRRFVTVTLILIASFSFAFSFGNIWALGIKLGVPAFVAPLVGPATDLSVAGLLVAVQRLAMDGVDARQLRPARCL